MICIQVSVSDIVAIASMRHEVYAARGHGCSLQVPHVRARLCRRQSPPRALVASWRGIVSLRKRQALLLNLICHLLQLLPLHTSLSKLNKAN